MFSKIASIITQFSENEVTLDTTFLETKAEQTSDMIEIAQAMVKDGSAEDLEDFDTTPFTNDMSRVKKGMKELKSAHLKDRDTLRKECYQELGAEIGVTEDTSKIASLETSLSTSRTRTSSLKDHVATLEASAYNEHKAYLPSNSGIWAFEITFTRGEKEPRYTGFIPLMAPNGCVHSAVTRPAWWKPDGTPTNPLWFPHMTTAGAVHVKADAKCVPANAQNPYKMWQFWCKLNNPFPDESVLRPQWRSARAARKQKSPEPVDEDESDEDE